LSFNPFASPRSGEFFEENGMAESDNLLTKLLDVQEFWLRASSGRDQRGSG
jgi:hypothetical protein